MKLLKTLSLLLLSLPFWLTGCISDDMSTCPPTNNLNLLFSYLEFPKHIHAVNLGIYNQEGILVATREVNQEALTDYRGVQLNLDEGSYTVICWGNAFDNTQIKGLTIGESFASQEVAHPGYFTPQRIPTNDPLYYGIHTFNVQSGVETSETVNFTPAHIRLVIHVEGLASTAEGAPATDYPYIQINNLEPAYNHLMVTHGGPATYDPAISVNPQEKRAEAIVDVLRFEEQNPITIEVLDNRSNNTLLHSLDLQSFIAAHSIEIKAGEEVLIPIRITFDQGMNVTVALIESWGETPVNPQPQE